MLPLYTTVHGIELFQCERYQARITRKACSENWLSVLGKPMRTLERCHHCLGCQLGAIHSGRDYQPKPLTRICCRCFRPASRLVSDRICVSCYNRERELKIGLNARGTVPIHAKPIYFLPLEVQIQGVQKIVALNAAHKSEVALHSLRKDIQSKLAWSPKIVASGAMNLFRGI